MAAAFLHRHHTFHVQLPHVLRRRYNDSREPRRAPDRGRARCDYVKLCAIQIVFVNVKTTHATTGATLTRPRWTDGAWRITPRADREVADAFT